MIIIVMIKTPKSILVVGGGTAGFVSALILKTKFPHLKIDVVRSTKIGIVGVGEGSTEHWSDFMKLVGIEYPELIRECDSTFKSGIMFKGWSDEKPDYLHSINSGFNYRKNNYSAVLARQIASKANPNQMVSPQAWDSRVNTWFVGKEDIAPTAQFHFDTHKLNEFLTTVSINRGIEVFDDEIVEVKLDESGISSIAGEKNQYKYDFYIDSTGFKRLLIEQLGGKWQSHSKYLKMKSTLLFSSKTKEEIPSYTVAQAMNYGWMFSIPTYERTGNGYIFDSDYIDADAAKKEVEEFIGYKIDDYRVLTFDPGSIDKAWIKNCCAVGLSASFVEPLEASSIGTSIQQAFLLADLIVNYDDRVIKKYNSIVEGIVENIRDFIILHYVTNKNSSDFWKDMQSLELPEKLKNKLSLWKHKLPTLDDFIDTSAYRLFNDQHHIFIMFGLGLFDVESIQKEYCYNTSDDTKGEVESLLDHEINLRCQTIPHRTMLDIIRNTRNENY